MKRLLILVAILSITACASSGGEVRAKTADAILDARGDSPFPIDPTTKLCVTLQAHRDVYDTSNPNEWLDFSGAFGRLLTELNGAGNYYVFAEPPARSVFSGGTSACSSFVGRSKCQIRRHS